MRCKVIARCGVAAMALAHLLAAEASVAQPVTGGSLSNDGETQDPSQPDHTPIVVTGSRVASALDSPTPTIAIGADALERRQAVSAADLLSIVPSLKATTAPSASGTRNNLVGVSQADLRGLGPDRTLVLVDGMRIVPQVPSVVTGGIFIAPDLNTIPALMINRAEVVTGGASAQYGSDAVAGVVNILLKKRHEGTKLTMQSGISQYGDAFRFRVGGVTGLTAADGRVNLVASAEYSHSDGVGNMYSRPWGRMEYQSYANNGWATNGLPRTLIVPHVRGYTSPGGLIAGPSNFSLRGLKFLPDGSLTSYDAGEMNNGSLQIGGEGPALAGGTDLEPSVERLVTYARASIEVGSVELYALGGWSMVNGQVTINPSRDSNMSIRIDNAFLPQQVVDEMQHAGISSFSLNRYNTDIGGNTEVFLETRTPRLAAGAEGPLGGGWDWNVQGGWAENHYKQRVPHSRIMSHYNFARDAVWSDDDIVCRATIPGPSFNPAAAGCVPIDIFGEGNPSSAAVDYVTGTAASDTIYRQVTAAANIRGDLLEISGRPVSVATGVEYRRETQKVVAAPLSEANEFLVGNATSYRGTFDVVEGYAEAHVPLVTDVPGVRRLDLNGAIRLADYSSVGLETTWKVGALYEPLDGLRLRITRSRDLRAPAVHEIANPGSQTTTNVTVRGITASIPTVSGAGNPDLLPEVGDTFSVGMVLEPIRGLNLSIDYYDIMVEQAITTVRVATVASMCTEGNQQFCDMFTFNSAGVPTALNVSVVNAASVRNRGIDFVAGYNLPIASPITGDRASLLFNFAGTYTISDKVNLGLDSLTVDRAGENSNYNNYALPHFRSNFEVVYDEPSFQLAAEAVFVSAGKIDNTFNTTPSSSINLNRVPASVIVNLSTRYRIGEKPSQLELFAGIDNLFNRWPPPVPNQTGFTITNGQYYSNVGRMFKIGVSKSF